MTVWALEAMDKVNRACKGHKEALDPHMEQITTEEQIIGSPQYKADKVE